VVGQGRKARLDQEGAEIMVTNSSLERYYNALVAERRLNVPTFKEAAKDLEAQAPSLFLAS
jgi:hypothetical protein